MVATARGKRVISHWSEGTSRNFKKSIHQHEEDVNLARIPFFALLENYQVSHCR